MDAKGASAAAACDVVVGESSIRKWIELLYFTLHILFPFVDDVKQPCTHNIRPTRRITIDARSCGQLFIIRTVYLGVLYEDITRPSSSSSLTPPEPLYL